MSAEGWVLLGLGVFAVLFFLYAMLDIGAMADAHDDRMRGLEQVNREHGIRGGKWT
jgi:hypothetical protein